MSHACLHLLLFVFLFLSRPVTASPTSAPPQSDQLAFEAIKEVGVVFGEQYDPDLGLYYLRARFYSPRTGRFWTMDSWEGKSGNPITHNKYLYGNADSINHTDPTGRWSMGGTLGAAAISGAISSSITASINIATTGNVNWQEVRNSFGAGAAKSLIGGAALKAVWRVMGPVVRNWVTPYIQRIGDMDRIVMTGRSGVEHLLIRMSRFFINTNARHPKVGETLLGRFLQRTVGGKWEMHHRFISRAMSRQGGPNAMFDDVMANEGLKRIGNGLWNLVPLPKSIHSFYHAHEAVSNQVIAGIYAGLTSGAGYEFISSLVD